ncbi:hypothetical protein SAMN02746041_02148 [Desulfacinum hydrothermale DSM 13146]|uniref:Uncharacterized protein n=1 Tax=Desulfacinum hydrothermale DSM 13146 TaxID=1121390 RepID=A0A1W1XM81_9BACT|nr:UPF0280 family protein [Desulfacinum hydrothermale]SMC24927.1 hypothetical protein SAMN02746041_02148 [Desulfacinum hydrothermale DSM 13146]
MGRQATGRFYRYRHKSRGWRVFQVRVAQTDLWIRAQEDLSRPAHDLTVTFRRQLEKYAASDPRFLHAMEPLEDDPLAPPLVRSMLRAGRVAGVGPMAAVAGAIAQAVAEGLVRWSPSVLVENGGDCYLISAEDLVVSIYPGRNSPFRHSLAIRLAADTFPWAVCTSSASIGHSLSLGRADAATVLAKDAAVADACATALGNRIRRPEDLESAMAWVEGIPHVEGALAVCGDKLAAWGAVELTAP